MLLGLSLGCSCAFYPLGWDSNSVRAICGLQSGIYRLGRCTIGWCYWTAIGSSAIALLAAILALTRFVMAAKRDRQMNSPKVSATEQSSPSHDV